VKAKPRSRPEPFYNPSWWPIEVAIVWVATGDPALCQRTADFVTDRRARPGARLPTLAIWLMVPEGVSTLYEATPGAIYRKRIRKDWKPGDAGPHPLDRAFAETAKILRGSIRDISGRISVRHHELVHRPLQPALRWSSRMFEPVGEGR
jgi:hypothetical protein